MQYKIPQVPLKAVEAITNANQLVVLWYSWPVLEDTSLDSTVFLAWECFCLSYHGSLPALPVYYWLITNNSYLIRFCVVKMVCRSCGCGRGSQIVSCGWTQFIAVETNKQGMANSAEDVFWNVNDEPLSSIQFTKSIRVWLTVNLCCKSELLAVFLMMWLS